MTQHEAILQYVKQFGSITPLQAVYDLNITKLATRISEMKRNGTSFRSEIVVYQNRFGQKKRYNKYFLEE